MPADALLYYSLILTNTFLTALYLVLTSGAMKARHLSPNGSIAVIHLIAAGVLLPFWLVSAAGQVGGVGGGFMGLPTLPTLAITGLVLVSVALKLLSKELQYYAYAHTDVANVTVFSAFVPILGLVSGWALLGETPGTWQVAGTVIICLAVYVQFVDVGVGGAGGEGRRLWTISTLFSPFGRLAHSRAIQTGFASIFPPAVAAVAIKQAALGWHPLGYATMASFLIGMGALGIEAVMHRPGLAAVFRQLLTGRFLLVGLIFSAAHLSFVLALSMRDIGPTMALERFSIVFQTLLASVILKESTALPKRLILGLV
ncbi:MAG: EamA family transporter, partial [Cyanobacteria bacterium HKST-UBA06]|nr:EamA family transporter [Cyanobacteria bacterium HKST-UBA06]